ncbi:MarR family winged helix-turn-helix transcriptional regulator [Paraburkholderia sp.]|uniref:MarR family winged helix-turn-helix transcriptional regulator n=1 Tax=Paraburkholderia sp. TaxID=1926495 RepID=UPI00239A8F9E|nr:MarR family winged helix-turn-helix transcriptional regulator [Paraburkholderia sp.]MDE1182617.1 MarR family winged helix-turn-helix transcriptional regulator [Paraburkholderia sp.]
MTQRTENLLGVLALLVTDELNAQPAVSALSGATARAMLNSVAQYPDSSIEVLREAVDLSHPAAVRAIAGLVDAGLIEKKDGADKRAVAVALTAAGRREIRRMHNAREQMLERVLSHLDADERSAFETMLIKILWHETRDPAHAMQLCRLCDDKPCLKAGCPVECRDQGLPMPSAETS